jgi:hypothetical protein
LDITKVKKKSTDKECYFLKKIPFWGWYFYIKIIWPENWDSFGEINYYKKKIPLILLKFWGKHRQIIDWYHKIEKKKTRGANNKLTKKKKEKKALYKNRNGKLIS